MTDTTRSPSNEPFDLDMIRADEALLGSLGRGEPVEQSDSLGTLLTAWRADLIAEPPQTSPIRPAQPDVAGAQAEPMLGNAQRRAAQPHVRISRRARIAVAAAVIAAIAGGTAAAAATATPGSPLWSISQLINPARADRIAAEDALAQARRAIDNRNFRRARQALDQAESLISRVHDPRQAARLRVELQELTQRLVTATAPSVPPPTTTAAPVPAPSSSPARSARPPATPGAPAGGPGPLLPSPLLPGQHTHSSPTPTGPGLLPSLPPLPSLLPTLPIHGIGD
jgi:hypothetical protein